MSSMLEKIVDEKRRELEDEGREIEKTGIRGIAEVINHLKGKGYDIIDFALADPNFKYPLRTRLTLMRHIIRGKSNYFPAIGTEDLREAISKYENTFIGEELFRKDDVVFCPGVTGALRATLEVIADIGERNKKDKVILLSPYFPLYKDEVEDLGLVPEIIDINGAHNLGELIEEKVSQKDKGKVKAIIINSPNNPTGKLMPESDIIAIAEIANNHGKYIISDEVYKSLIYTDSEGKFSSIAQLAPEYTLTLDGITKMFSMSGFRGGWACTKNEELIRKIARKKGLMNTSDCDLTEIAALTALNNCMYYPEKMKDVYEQYTKEIRLRLLKELGSLGVECEEPDGTFYLSPKIPGIDSIELTWQALKHGVGIVPGNLFANKRHQEYIRIALCNYDKLEKIIDGTDKLIKAVNVLYEEKRLNEKIH